jgi:hypothetical protein
MSNPYRVKIVDGTIVKRGHLCPICGEYRKTKTCNCESDNIVDNVVKKVKKTKKKNMSKII